MAGNVLLATHILPFISNLTLSASINNIRLQEDHITSVLSNGSFSRLHTLKWSTDELQEGHICAFLVILTLKTLHFWLPDLFDMSRIVPANLPPSHIRDLRVGAYDDVWANLIEPLIRHCAPYLIALDIDVLGANLSQELLTRELASHLKTLRSLRYIRDDGPLGEMENLWNECCEIQELHVGDMVQLGVVHGVPGLRTVTVTPEQLLVLAAGRPLTSIDVSKTITPPAMFKNVIGSLTKVKDSAVRSLGISIDWSQDLLKMFMDEPFLKLPLLKHLRIQPSYLPWTQPEEVKVYLEALLTQHKRQGIALPQVAPPPSRLRTVQIDLWCAVPESLARLLAVEWFQLFGMHLAPSLEHVEFVQHLGGGREKDQVWRWKWRRNAADEAWETKVYDD